MHQRQDFYKACWNIDNLCFKYSEITSIVCWKNVSKTLVHTYCGIIIEIHKTGEAVALKNENDQCPHSVVWGGG